MDFHWGEYTYSMEGEGDILLSELLRILDASDVESTDGEPVDLAALAEDMTQIESVTFSDPALLDIQEVESIDRTEGDPDGDYAAESAAEDGEDEDDEALLASLRPDWLLRSLAPFDTDETLTLTLTGGRTVEIAVTDARVAGQATSNRTRVTVDGVTYTLTVGGISVNNNNRIPNSTQSGQYPNMANCDGEEHTPYYGKATVYALSAGCTIHDEITYEGNLYKVWNIATSSNNLTKIGAKLDREFVNRAAGYKFSLPKVKTDISDEEKAQLRNAGFVFGRNNEEDNTTSPATPAADNKLWKKSVYDPATNSITYEIVRNTKSMQKRLLVRG